MKNTLFRILSLLTLLIVIRSAFGTTLYGPVIYLKPIHGLNAFVLPGANASKLVESCGIHRADLIQFWIPSEKQVRIVDKKIDLQLKNIEPKSDSYEFVRLYFGLTNDLKDEHIYAFIFPNSINKKLTLDFGNDELICLELKSIADFNLKNFELQLLKPDTTSAINRKRKLP